MMTVIEALKLFLLLNCIISMLIYFGTCIMLKIKPISAICQTILICILTLIIWDIIYPTIPVELTVIRQCLHIFIGLILFTIFTNYNYIEYTIINKSNKIN